MHVTNAKKENLWFQALAVILALGGGLGASPDLMDLGWQAYRESRLEEAERYWREAAREGQQGAKEALARLQGERLKLASGEPYAKAALEWYERGMKAYRRSHWVEAEEALAHADALVPGHDQILARLKEVRAHLARPEAGPPDVLVPTRPWEASAPALSAAPAKSPPPRRPPKPKEKPAPDAAEVKRLYEEGMRAYRKKRYLQAIEAWRKVVALDPHHQKALKNIRTVEALMEVGKEVTVKPVNVLKKSKGGR